VEVFPVVQATLNRITGEDQYKSPTDMGVNMAGYCITDDEAVRHAAEQEIMRRYFHAQCDYTLGRIDEETAHRVDLLLRQMNLKTHNRPVVDPANQKGEQAGVPALALQLHDGSIVTGKASDLMSPAGYEQGLQYLRFRRQEVTVIQTLSPDELHPEMTGDLRLIDSESGESRDVSLTPGLVAAYEQRLRSHQEAVRSFCHAQGVSYLPVSSDRKAEEVVLEALRGAGVVA
jgi:uncharacterized protein (UPF0371 family)